MTEPTPTAIAVSSARTPTRSREPLSWPYVVVRPVDDHPLAHRVVGGFGLVLGGSAGLVLGGLLGGLLAFLLMPFFPGAAELLLMSVTLSSLMAGAIVGRHLLERETFE